MGSRECRISGASAREAMTNLLLMVLVVGVIVLAIIVHVGVVVAWLAGHRFWGIIGLLRARWLGARIMDWLQFISSIVVAFAWPSVLIVLMVILRKQISALAGRIEEVTLPGGAKAKFEKAIAEARENTEKIEPAVRDTPTPEIQPQDSLLYLANNFPEAAIIESFREVEGTLWEMVPFLGLPTKGRAPQYVIEALQRKRYIDDNTANLFQNLREARNAAAHAGRVNRVGPGDAIEFREQARTLNELLRRVLADMRVTPPSEAWDWVKEQARERAESSKG
jgi:hypothetical protein